MLIIIIDVILGVFISSYKSVNHPYITCFLKGGLIGVSGFLLAILYNAVVNKYFFSFSDLFLFFIFSQGIGLIVSIIYLIIEYLFPDEKDREI